MASIRGISVDQYVESEMDRGMYFAGFILMDGKNIGRFENEGEGGCTEFDFESKEDAGEFHNRVSQYFSDHPATLDDHEGFMLEVLDLMEAEREFIKKTYQLKGPFILIQANTYGRSSTLDDITEISTSYHVLQNEEELVPLQIQLRAVEYFIFRNAEDFIK
ncbi:hypothetical protein [Paenibacillus taichungensis]